MIKKASGCLRLRAIILCCAGTIPVFASRPALAGEVMGANQSGISSEQPPAAARPDIQDPDIQDIVVTARQRNETLISAPVAITALTARDITRYAATDLSKIGQLIPQLQIVRAGAGNGGTFVIRGVGSSVGDAGIEQSVSVNLDGLQISRGRAVLSSFFDVQQVEVLKGPQALFFGKNSPGGVISVKTAGPTAQWEGLVRSGYEFKADERYLEGVVSGPVTDRLGIRLAVRGSKMSGYLRNAAIAMPNPLEPRFPLPGAASAREPGNTSWAGRFTAQWKPSDAFEATLKLFANYSRDNAETTAEVVCANPAGLPVTNGQPDPTGDCRLDGVRSSSAAPADPALLKNWPGAPADGKHFSRFTGQYGVLSASYRWDNLRLISVSGYNHYNVHVFDNYDYTSLGFSQAVNTERFNAYSQEFRLVSDFDGPLNFVTGAYYERTSRQNGTAGRIAVAGPDPRNAKYHSWERPADNHGSTWSAFGQAIWKMTDQLELAGGVRWTHESKSLTTTQTFLHQALASSGAFLPEGTILAARFSDDNFSPEATLSWRPDRRTTFYIAYKTGYKSGGLSNPTVLTSAFRNVDSLRFGSEKASGGEVGAKIATFAGRLTANFAAYRYTFDDLQLSSFNADIPAFTIRNAAKARTTGAELETSFAVTPELSLRGSIAYNKARYLSFPLGSCYVGQSAAQGCVGGVQDLGKRPLVRAPDLALAGGASYDLPLSASTAVGFSVDATYTDSYFMQENENPVSLQQGFWRINATLRLHERDERWELALIGRNLTNKRYGTQSSDKPFAPAGQIVVTPGRPLEMILQATYKL